MLGLRLARRRPVNREVRHRVPGVVNPDEQEEQSGATDHVRNDVGIVTTSCGCEIALAIFVSGIPDVLWTADNAGLLAIARLSQMIVAHLTGEEVTH